MKDIYNDRQTDGLIDPGAIRTNHVGSEVQQNRKRNDADARYHRMARTKEKVSEYSRPCNACGTYCFTALTAGKRKRVILEANESDSSNRYTVEYNPRGLIEKFIATNVDAFDDQRGIIGHPFHRCSA